MLKATVSGSFHRHMAAISTAVQDLRGRGVDVLSPSDPRVVDYLGEFLFVASDRLRSIKPVQDRHFEAIRASDLLWVVCPDGYVGPSTSGEIGAAIALKVPIFSQTTPLDVTWRQYVRCVPSVTLAVHAVEAARRRRSTRRSKVPLPHLFLEPDVSVEHAHDLLEDMRTVLAGRSGLSPERETQALEMGLGSMRSLIGCQDTQ